jgi:flagellin-specific chaperone FliS
VALWKRSNLLFEKIANFAKQHFLGTIVTALITGAGTTAALYSSLYEAHINRIEEMKVTEFQAIVTEIKKFQELLNEFTQELAVTNKVDEGKKSEISATLVRLYSGLGAFTVNLSKENEPPVAKLQSSINEVKKRIQLTQSKPDLDKLGAALVVMFRDMKDAQPVLELAVGKTLSFS